MTSEDGFISELGCEVRVRRAPEHLGKGALLTLQIPKQGQFAEVYLNRHNLMQLLVITSEMRDSLGDEGAWYCPQCEHFWEVGPDEKTTAAFQRHIDEWHKDWVV